ncbi:hypothetical protein [Pararobbsia alpina]|uniref:hypothetical protein n=1 Tax=Pararobbsia alpina TaxID=621374 RepID=UPI0039A5EE94
MPTNKVIDFRGCEVRPVISDRGNGRYAATAVIIDRAGETRTLGLDRDFADSEDASDEALEVAFAWIQHRSVISERYIRRG